MFAEKYIQNSFTNGREQPIIFLHLSATETPVVLAYPVIRSTFSHFENIYTIPSKFNIHVGVVRCTLVCDLSKNFDYELRNQSVKSLIKVRRESTLCASSPQGEISSG